MGWGLFDDLRKQYPSAWGALPNTLREKFALNFEPAMKELWDSGHYDAATLMRCMADYFAQFRPLTGSAYHRVIEHLGARGALVGTYFSSLNYDCIFEYAGRESGFTISYDSPEPSGASALTVWKIHGSCNFLPVGLAGNASGVSYVASAVTWDGGIQFADCSQVRPFVVQNAFYPAMAVFMEGKPIHSNPSILRQCQSWWSDAVIAADTVGIIGVRPNPPDTHIWEPLANTKAALVVIGDVEAYEEWAGRCRSKRRLEVVGQKFAEDMWAFADAFSGVKL